MTESKANQTQTASTSTDYPNGTEPLIVDVPLQVSERDRVFDDYTGRGKSDITCIWGTLGTGKSTLVQDIAACCDNTVILDGDSALHWIFDDIKNPKTNSETDIIIARRLAKMALYFAHQGRDVVIDCVRADISFTILQNTLKLEATRSIKIKTRRSSKVAITLRKVESQHIVSF